MRNCFCPPIQDVYEAARLLDAAVTAHQKGRTKLASELLQLANMRSIWEWTDSVWGKKSPFIQYREVPGQPIALPKEQRVKVRMPTAAEQKQIHARDGYYCRFCEMPVIRKEIRVKMQAAYPEAISWGRTNDSQHAAFQAMWAQYDHVVPHARGGDNDLSNVVLTCAPCNFGRMNYTLEEVAIADPRLRVPRGGPWDGLERF